MNKVESLKKLIQENQNFAIFTHINTDGDALGSSFGFYGVLKNMGKNVDLFCESGIPKNLDILHVEKVLNKKTQKMYDVAISLDVGESDRMGIYEKTFYTIKQTVQIDHHLNNPNFAQLNFVNPEASSTCEFLYQLLMELGFDVDKEIAERLLVGIITDTGGLRFANTTKETLRVVYELVSKYELNMSEIMSEIFESMDFDSFETYRYAMKNTTLYEDGKIAIIIVDNKFLTNNNIPLSATKLLTRIGTELKEVLCTVAIVEEKKNEFRISLRGRKGCNVERCARDLGGGGHMYAAGCKLYGHIETVKEKILKALKDEIDI